MSIYILHSWTHIYVPDYTSTNQILFPGFLGFGWISIQRPLNHKFFLTLPPLNTFRYEVAVVWSGFHISLHLVFFPPSDVECPLHCTPEGQPNCIPNCMSTSFLANKKQISNVTTTAIFHMQIFFHNPKNWHLQREWTFKKILSL